LSSERTSEGWVLSVRPSGIGRYFAAAFLTVWLCGWAVGEVLVVWVLGAGAWALIAGHPLPGKVPPGLWPMLGVGAFLLTWVSFWTLGGIAAINEWLRLVSSEERLTVTGDRILIARRRGPWTFRSAIPRADVTRVRVSIPHRKLTLDTRRKSIEFAALPGPGETAAAVQDLARELNLDPHTAESGDALPEGWEESISPEGDRIVTSHAAFRRRAAAYAAGLAGVAWVVALLTAWSAMQGTSSVGGAIAAVVFAAGFAGLAFWLHREQTEIVIGSGRLVWRRRSGRALSERFVAERLEFTTRTDSDGDVWFRLCGVSAGGGDARDRRRSRERTVLQTINDPLPPTALGAWLAKHAGVPFHRPRTSG
jgi:hypothetical protein